jgi:hypothetical protein
LRQAKLRLADSGAFTFRSAGLGQGDASALSVDFDAYLDAYCQWIVSMSRLGLIDYWVELDIGLVAGTPWVLKHRQKFLAMGLGRGLVQVWHSGEHDWNDWLALIEEACLPGRSRYVAIEGHQTYRGPLDYARFIKAAYDRGVRVHAFKITGHEDLKRYPFWSVDSTSWTYPVRHDINLQTVVDGGIMFVKRSTKFTNSRTYKAPLGRSLSPQQRLDVLINSAKSWVIVERQLDDLWTARGVDWRRAIEEHT